MSSDCCIQKNVRESCRKVCSFDVDLGILRTLDNPLDCLPDADEIISCAAGKESYDKQKFICFFIASLEH